MSERPPSVPPAPSSAAWNRIREIALERGFRRFGVAALSRPASIDLYKSWLDRGFAGEMNYLEEHLAAKEEPSRAFQRARSALVVAVDYVPHPAPEASPRLRRAKIARYARGRDYHHWLKGRLRALAEVLQSEFSSEEFLCFTDSAPILERDLAVRAGLGWVGKNTCVIDRRGGSLFLVGEILTTLPSPAAVVETPDHCGTCMRCLEACPTQALIEPRVLDARKCISYLTIESKGAPPLELREKIGDWLFGCDVCQTVCPWNVKAYGESIVDPPPARSEELEEIGWILRASNRELERAFKGSPLARPGAVGLKRNALIVAANRGLHELAREIASFAEHPRLGEVAKWALHRLENRGE